MTLPLLLAITAAAFLFGAVVALACLIPHVSRRAQVRAYERDLDRRLKVRKDKRLNPVPTQPRAPNGRFTKPAR